MMSAKKMIETYVRFGLDEATWNMFYQMRNHDLISYDAWVKFCETCKGYELAGELEDTIIDTANNNKVMYVIDENGFWVKA